MRAAYPKIILIPKSSYTKNVIVKSNNVVKSGILGYTSKILEFIYSFCPETISRALVSAFFV